MAPELWWIVAAIVVSQVQVDGQSCYSTDPSPSRLYGTKTAYDRRLQDTPHTNTTTAGCQPVLVWHLNRHGSRYPGDDDIQDINRALNDIRSRMGNITGMCMEDVDGLRNWKSRMVPEDGEKLVATGERELFDIARRYRRRYPTLMNTSYSEANFKFRHSDRQRTKMSAKYFARGLFSSSSDANYTDDELNRLIASIKMVTVPADQDKLIRFYDSCEKYIKTVDDVPNVQYDKFESSDEINEVLRSVSDRLALDKQLSLGELELMYDSCIFEYAIYAITKDSVPRDSRGSPWCAVFTRSELQVMDFRNDLEYYYEDGYGHKINYQQTCTLVKDFFYYLSNATHTNAHSPHAVMRFGHSAAINSLTTRLGLFKDSQPLVADGYDRSKDRLFRVSRNTPMAANVAFVLFNCSGEFKFKLFVNEAETAYPGCTDMLCDFSVLSSTMGEIARSCNQDEICRYEDPSTTTQPTSGGRVGTKMETWGALVTVLLLYKSLTA